MKKKYKRFCIFMLSFALLSLGVALVLGSAKQNTMFFVEPTQILNNKNLYIDKKIKLGGIVKRSSTSFTKNEFSFLLTDCKNDIKVKYRGFLPNMFRDDQGIIIYGKYNGNYINAEKILTKHDEYYRPKNGKMAALDKKCGG
ncbi:MAG: cytochrome c maturation protein CcmE [Rickettsiales bacterium]